MSDIERFDARRNNRKLLTEAWRQAHFAAQAAAELGKGWAEAKDDDSHSSMFWRSSHWWRGLIGHDTVGETAFRSSLHFDDLVLRIEREEHEVVAELALSGRTLDEAIAWIRAEAERLIGPPLQEAQPAPDLPDHRLGSGGKFKRVRQLDSLAELYDISTLEVCSHFLRTRFPLFPYPLCWPHHFDLASLLVVARDEDGTMTRTIGMGVTPPDSVDEEGYWYVSPWTKHPVDNVELRDLLYGRWHQREGALPMAVRPVNESAEQARDFYREALIAFEPILL